MPLGVILFMSIASLIGIANGTPKIEWHCVERNRVMVRPKYYSIPRRLVPWPLRRGIYTFKGVLKKGDKNRCTGETWNGQWWFKEAPRGE